MLPSLFNELLEQFREGQIEFADSQDRIALVPAGASPSNVQRYELGHALLWGKFPGTFHGFQFTAYMKDIEEVWFTRFRNLAEESGAHLPLRVADRLSRCIPTTPTAWWLSTVWAFQQSQPSARRSMPGGYVCVWLFRARLSLEQTPVWPVPGLLAFLQFAPG